MRLDIQGGAGSLGDIKCVWDDDERVLEWPRQLVTIAYMFYIT
jgi:hypothetical protein